MEKETFGSIIRNARIRLCLNHSDVVKNLNRSTSSVTLWEQGKTLPSDTTLVEGIAKNLRLDPKALLAVYRQEVQDQFQAKSKGHGHEKANAFSALILKRRKDLGLQRKETAAKVEVSRDILRMWEIGRRYPKSNEQVERLAKALSLPVETLLNKLPTPAQPSLPVAEIDRTPITTEAAKFLVRTLEAVGGEMPLDMCVHLLKKHSQNNR